MNAQRKTGRTAPGAAEATTKAAPKAAAKATDETGRQAAAARRTDSGAVAAAPSAEGPIKRGPLLVEEVLQRMRRSIVQGDWELGEKISEARVAASLGTSKTPVREALVQLKREGLVEIRPQAGTYVFTLAPGELNQICEVRWILESAALRRAFEVDAHAELAARLNGVLEEMRVAWAGGDVRSYLHLDGALHEAICASCGNPYIAQSYALIAGKVAALRTHLGTDRHHMQKSFAEHARLVELVERGALEEALALLGRHIARKEGSYWEHLNQTAAGGILPPLRQE